MCLYVSLGLVLPPPTPPVPAGTGATARAESHQEPIVTGLASPVDVAVDSAAGHIYWSDVGRARTERSWLDGQEVPRRPVMGAQVVAL